MSCRTSLSMVFLKITVILTSFLVVSPMITIAQEPNMAVYIGPFTNSDGEAVFDMKVFVNNGAETKNGTTAANGTARVVVPKTWVNETVTVRSEKDGYRSEKFTGKFDVSGKFTPTSNEYPVIKKQTNTATADNQFLIIAFIVLVIFCLILVGMKDTSKVKDKDLEKDNDRPVNLKSKLKRPKKMSEDE